MSQGFLTLICFPSLCYFSVYTLLQSRFQDSKCDPSLFTYNFKQQLVYLSVYVHDIIFTGSSSKLVYSSIQKLYYNFTLKQLDELDYLLEIEVKNKQMVPFCSHKASISEIYQNKYARGQTYIHSNDGRLQTSQCWI